MYTGDVELFLELFHKLLNNFCNRYEKIFVLDDFNINFGQSSNILSDLICTIECNGLYGSISDCTIVFSWSKKHFDKSKRMWYWYSGHWPLSNSSFRSCDYNRKIKKITLRSLAWLICNFNDVDSSHYYFRVCWLPTYLISDTLSRFGNQTFSPMANWYHQTC